MFLAQIVPYESGPQRIKVDELESNQKSDLLNQALAHRRAGRLEDLRRVCHELLAHDGQAADAWFLLGVAALDQSDAEQARECLGRAIDLDRSNPQYCNAMAVALLESGQHRQAEATLETALIRNPRHTDLLCNLGRVLMLRERPDEASARFAQVLELDPGHSVARFNLGALLQSMGRPAAAIDHYRRALRSAPGHAKWWANLGAAQLSLADYTGAAASFRQGLVLAPEHPMSLRGLGVACCALGAYEEAGTLLRRCLSLFPKDAEAMAHLAAVYQQTADWLPFEQLIPQVDRQTRAALACDERPAEQPLFNISRSADEALNLAVARAWSRSIAQSARRAAAPFTHGRPTSDGRITIGYLSADFRSHAVAHQAVALFELHDHRKFRICGFSVGPSQEDEYRRRIAAACDRFVDLSAADSRQAAQCIYEDGVDILVDLMGHTHQNRLDICALRPAPLQVSYLGFLASSGADFIDYLVGDPVVTPFEHAAWYSEKIIQLPDCYQIISPVAAPPLPFTRAQAGLPETGFVFCCFNQSYKIDARIFSCWMNVLRAVPASVLWLYRSNDSAVKNLKAAAAKHGIRPERLVFADKLPLADHLNRLRLADLALDTPLYNGGATTANALAAGVPLIATMGTHFVSRMSASHLEALGMGALVTSNLDHYQRLAVSLAGSASQLGQLRQMLRTAADASPLFDARRFVRNLEKAYSTVWSRYRRGLPPQQIRIEEAVDMHTDIQPNKIESRAL
jgi:predicted O-linked N-acetylglucosamine transferase (SPINDLY family)